MHSLNPLSRALFILMTLALAFFLSACYEANRLFSGQPIHPAPQAKPQPTTPPDFKILAIKSEIFTYYDYALVRTQGDDIIIELFKLGNNVGNITIGKDSICFMNDCSPKWPATKKFFGKVAYRDMFNDIIIGRDIFRGKGKMVGPNDTTIQRFQEGGQVLFYERRKGHILFRNLSNGFMLSIDDYVDPAKQYDITDDDDSTTQP